MLTLPGACANTHRSQKGVVVNKKIQIAFQFGRIPGARWLAIAVAVWGMGLLMAPLPAHAVVYSPPANGCFPTVSYSSVKEACQGGAQTVVTCGNIQVPAAVRSLTSATLTGMTCDAVYEGVQVSNGAHFTGYFSLLIDNDDPLFDFASLGQAGCMTCFPIMPATGEKILNQADYTGTGPDALVFERYYRSNLAGGPPRALVLNPGLGQAWSHNHATSILEAGTPGTASATAKVIPGDGRVSSFAWQVGSSTWAPVGNTDSLIANGTGLLYKRAHDNSNWQFDAAGRLLTMTRRNGWATTYTYSTASTPPGVAPVPGLLITVSNSFGRALNFTYNAGSQLASVTTPDAQTISFAFSSSAASGRLSTVTYPGSTSGTVSKTYHYEDAAFAQMVTGITDEAGNRYATIAYDSQGRAVSSQLAGGAGNTTVSYPAPGSAIVTDPLGTARTFTYSTVQGHMNVSAGSLPTPGAASDAASRVIDANGLVTQETDYLGVNTTTTWDAARRLPLAVTRASGLPEAQTTSTTWHSTFTLPTLVTETGRSTGYTYDSLGNTLSTTVTDASSSVARTTSWTYTGQGLPATETDPTGVVTRIYAYYPSTSFSGTAPNETGHTAGDLQSITNAASHVTQFTLYDRAGRVKQMVDPNGVVTEIAYTPRGGISSTTVTPSGGTARTTSYTYDNVGQLTGATLPDSTTMSYSYDAAHRLKGVTDAKGNSVIYTLDSAGNRIGEQVKDPSGNLQRNITRVYDALNRVQQVTGAGN